MARRRKSTEPSPTPAAGADPQPALPPRVLIVAATRALRDLVAAHLDEATAAAHAVARADEARARLDDAGPYDVVMIQPGSPAADSLALEIAEQRPGTSVVLLGETTTLEDAVAALRCGAVDVLSPRLARGEFIARTTAACAKARRARAREERVERLRRLCRQLQSARVEMSRHIESLCGDLAGAYRDLNDRINDVALATEFGSLIRRELDIESLLRTTLEFVLTKSGPTNAAIFLPAASGDFSLGAYVNYDGPKEAAEMLLDHLASSLAPRFEGEREVRVLAGREQLRAALGDDAEWIGDSTLMAVPCREDADCLAVMVLFRDQGQPFPAELKATISLISDLFARQLARVIHVHHRHLPPSKWGDAWGQQRDADDGFPDIDLAA